MSRVRRALAATLTALLAAASPAAADRGDIWTIAGGAPPAAGDQVGPLGDGGPAVSATLRQPVDVAVQPDGGVLVADLTARRVRRVAPDGTMATVAGVVAGAVAVDGPLGDGGPAVQARLGAPQAVAVDPRGGFAVVDGADGRVRHVGTDGVIRTIAGNGTIGRRTVDGVPATSVPLGPIHIAYAPDGTLYLTEAGLLSRMTPDGTIAEVASNGNFGAGLAIAPTGDVYVGGGHGVFRVDASGTVTLITGVPGDPGSSPDGVAASAARYGVVADLDVDTDGTLYLAEDGRIRRIRDGVLDTVAGGGSAATATGCASATRAAEVAARAIDVAGTRLYLAAGDLLRVVALAAEPCPGFVSVPPTRVLETREAEGRIGHTGGRPAPGDVLRISFVGSTLVPSGSRTVMLNVTATESARDGFVTAWACDDPVPSSSNLNVRRGGTAANAVLVTLGASREVCLLDQAGAHLVADVTGYIPTSVPFVAAAPSRVLDTRSGGVNRPSTVAPAAGETVEVHLGRVGALSSTTVPGATVVLNVTAIDATDDGYVTVWSCQGPRPTASNLNVTRGGTVGRLVVAAVGGVPWELGTTGAVCVFTQSGAHIAVDVLGVFEADAPYLPVLPTRVLETRSDVGQVGYVGTRPTAGQVVEVDVVGRSAGRVPSDARAVVLSLTATNPAGAGFVTAWPCGSPRPLASSLNLAGSGDTQSNAVVVGLGTEGKVCVFTQRGADLVADVNGVFV